MSSDLKIIGNNDYIFQRRFSESQETHTECMCNILYRSSLCVILAGLLKGSP